MSTRYRDTLTGHIVSPEYASVHLDTTIGEHVDEAADLERACEVLHDAYETAAIAAGWETQAASRKPWAEVPEPNKATMRVAVAALLHWLEDPV